jgi:hypothetical protein
MDEKDGIGEGAESIPGAERISSGAERISLWKLDQLMRGDLPEREAQALRAAVSRSPEALAYLERNGSLRSGLTLDRIRSGAGPVARKARSPGFVDAFFSWGRPRGPGLALAFTMVLGLAVWTWRAQQAPPPIPESQPQGKFRAKGPETADFRIKIRGVAYDTGQIISAANGDTLAVEFRGPRPVAVQIWYQEDGGGARPMSGESESASLAAALAWHSMDASIILEGKWDRQSVIVVSSEKSFPMDRAKSALGGSPHADLRVHAFRMVRRP